ncbi:hypothetical protein FIBSPDRAFT_730602 [Athelia psychrophila]|uniref:CxC1-like cysteine cluster associated with KDZ transposases domain-containing protein n=1 Tax=Athelia psychrophila TaxID=1759441 RepID=A0A166QST3_9AGAM|nr:hypothetical protein FIBSPDRAFT_730602 [Fibularhizoctonia sp. CBS 109695]
MKHSGNTGITGSSPSSILPPHTINTHEPVIHNSQSTLPSHSKAAIPDSGSSPSEWSKKSQNLQDNWETLLPTLQEPLLLYYHNSIGRTVRPSEDIPCNCHNVSCKHRVETLWCFYYDLCNCATLPQQLVANGLFPTAPKQPRMAISVDLLDLYKALFERSCDAVQAITSALCTFYERRGFCLLDDKGQSIIDPLRRSFSSAVQRFDTLRVKIEASIDKSVQNATADIDTPAAGGEHPSCAQSQPSAVDDMYLPGGNLCARFLSQRCPACFGGLLWGKSAKQGGDVHVALDGNFEHRHLQSAGCGITFYQEAYLVSKEKVDAMGIHIEKLRCRKPRDFQLPVPEAVLDKCASAFTAANGSIPKADSSTFDDTGLMALCCRHDIPLLLANIDTPGEQQKYAFALLVEFFGMLPEVATCVALYDVGCTTDVSNKKWGILPDSISSRLEFAISVMHAYAHQWACQIAYNPRMRCGLGLTDGEGVERLWSRLCRLIRITRSCGRARRLWLIDRFVHTIGSDIRDELGDILRRKLKLVKKQGNAAQKQLDEAGVSRAVLEQQWNEQQAYEMQLGGKLAQKQAKTQDKLLSIQNDLEKMSRKMKSFKISNCSEVSNKILTANSIVDSMKSNAETLLAGLDDRTGDSMSTSPELDPEAVKLLAETERLKRCVRKLAIGSFFEWDKIDQAKRGHQAVGTKQYQYMRRAIAKRRPLLDKLIRKHNDCSERLQLLHQLDSNVPLPRRLPATLMGLRNSMELLEDVVSSAFPGGIIPRWLADENVRSGIRAIMKLDRCKEEQLRVAMEAGNLRYWFGRELCALELAINNPKSQYSLFVYCQVNAHAF